MLDGAYGPFLVAGLAALALFGAVFALLFPYISGDREKDKRVKGIGEGRNRKLAVGAGNDQNAGRKKSVADSLKEIETRQKAKEKVTLRLRLKRAGIDTSPRDFYIASGICGVLCGAGVFFGLNAPFMGALVAAFVGTFGLPRWYINRRIKKRQAKFLAGLPSAIDVIVRGVKTGLPLNECIQIIARESPEPLASEFKEAVDEGRLGVPLGEALNRMCDRLPLTEVRFLSIVISIQQQAGGNLSEALGNLAGVLRDRVTLQQKVKALSAEALASAGVLASLPPSVMFMVYLTTPDYIMLLFTTLPGKFMLAVGAVWMSIGILVMRKMINFKF
jgi:tight adherence protein B